MGSVCYDLASVSQDHGHMHTQSVQRDVGMGIFECGHSITDHYITTVPSQLLRNVFIFHCIYHGMTCIIELYKIK